ncbi:MAG: leucine-rich repeat protein, partial [Eubacteriales bacterium]
MTDLFTNGDNIWTRSSILTPARLALQKKEWKRAEQYCDSVLEAMPECAEAYVIKLLAELHLGSEEELAWSTVSFEDRPSFQKAMLFSTEEQRNYLSECASKVARRRTSLRAEKRTQVNKTKKIAMISIICLSVCIVLSLLAFLVVYQTAPAEVEKKGLTLVLQDDGYAVTGTMENLATYDIPSMYHGRPVVAIGSFAFKERPIESITIPNSVKTIGGGAFSGCAKLTSVTIGNGVTGIGYGAFGDCVELASVTMGKKVTTIGGAAFFNCWKLSEIALPESLISIEDYAFYCSRLESVTIPDHVISIGNGAFYRSALTSVTMGKRVTSIGEYAFGSTSLESISLPDSVVSMGEGIFSSCSALKTVYIPEGIMSISEKAFYRCEKLSSIVLPNSVTSIGSYAFSGCTGLTSVTLSDSVT